MDVAAAVAGAAGAVLLPVTGAQMPQVPQSSAVAEANDTYFRQRWFEQDERSKGIPLLLRKGLVDDLDLFREDYIKRNAFYQDFLAPFGFRWFAGVKVATPDDAWCLSIQRTIDQGPFSSQEKQKLARLSETLSASAVLSKALSFAAAGAVLEAFEASGSAALLLNRNGEVYRANTSAERLLARDVQVIQKRVVAKDAAATAALDRALHELIWQRTGPGLCPPIVLPREGDYPLLAYPVRISGLSDNPLADCQAIVLLMDVGARRRVPEGTLRAVFGFTAAESRLAARIASGDATEAIATEIGLTKETIRAQLRSVFNKTDTHRQAELVALLGSLLQQRPGGK